jgi:hypothetical protein
VVLVQINMHFLSSSCKLSLLCLSDSSKFGF